MKDAKTADSVWWGDINIPFDSEKFDKLQEKMINFLADNCCSAAPIGLFV